MSDCYARGMSEYVGVDGCKSGWFAVGIDRSGRYEHGLFRTAKHLYRHFDDAERFLIDIQIGLSDRGPDGRRCEKDARSRLGPRNSSVFVSPARGTLDVDNYPDASAKNFELTGKKLSKQTWFIMDKIREVDQLVASDCDARKKFNEVNTELVFWALNGRKPMNHYKKTTEGFDERMDLLESLYPDSRRLYDECLNQYLRKDVARDDIVDAIAPAVGLFVANGEVATLPEQPEIDSTGLEIKMTYPVVG